MKITKVLESFFAPLLEAENDKLEALRHSIILAPKSRYFDFTASGLAYKTIQKRIASILPYYANTHSHFAHNAHLMSELYEQAKRHIMFALGLDDEFVLIAGGSGASFGIKKFQEIMGVYLPPKTSQYLGIDKKNLPNLPNVLISRYEHHSNEISYREGLCCLHKIKLDERGLLDIKDLKQHLLHLTADSQTPSLIIASLSVASNVTGILTPIAQCVPILRESQSLIALDMASSSAYMNVDSSCFDAAFLAPHKLLGGVSSCGLLAIRKNLIDTQLPPSFSGGGVIEYANDSQHFYITESASREEAGTPAIIGLLCAALAYQLRNEVGLDFIRRREKILTQAFIYELSNIPAVSIYGNLDEEKLGIVSFNVGSISPLDLCVMLSRKYGIQTRAGCSCAGPYGHYLMGEGSESKKPMWLRVSLHYTHSIEDIEYLISSLKSCIKILRG